MPKMERPAAAVTAKAGLYDRGSGPRGRFKPIRVADFSMKILSGNDFPILVYGNQGQTYAKIVDDSIERTCRNRKSKA